MCFAAEFRFSFVFYSLTHLGVVRQSRLRYLVKVLVQEIESTRANARVAYDSAMKCRDVADELRTQLSSAKTTNILLREELSRLKDTNAQLTGVVERQKYVRSYSFYIIFCPLSLLLSLRYLRSVWFIAPLYLIVVYRAVHEHTPSATEYLQKTVPIIQEERHAFLTALFRSFHFCRCCLFSLVSIFIVEGRI